MLYNFRLASAVAEYDNGQVSAGMARAAKSPAAGNQQLVARFCDNNTSDDNCPSGGETGSTYTVHYFTDPSTTQNSEKKAEIADYSPLDYIPTPDCKKAWTMQHPTDQKPGDKEPGQQTGGKNPAPVKQPPNAVTISTTWTASLGTQPALVFTGKDGTQVVQPIVAPPKSQEDNAKTATDQQQKKGTGCAYQSVHARQMALAGFKLADQYCHDFFARKRTIQNGNNVINDFASGATSLAGAVGGLVSGSPAAPAAIGSLVGISNQATALTNKDFLFGQDNIDTVEGLANTALVADTSTALPNPDVSDWTYDLAVGTIRRHEQICDPSHILTLIKQSVQNAAVQSKDSNGNTTVTCGGSGGAASTSSDTNFTPSTKATNVSVMPSSACAQTNTTITQPKK